jgi:hypothetical protein
MSRFMKILHVIAVLSLILAAGASLYNQIQDAQELQGKKLCWSVDRPHYAYVDGVLYCSLHHNGEEHTDTYETIREFYR